MTRGKKAPEMWSNPFAAGAPDCPSYPGRLFNNHPLLMQALPMDISMAALRMPDQRTPLGGNGQPRPSGLPT